MIDAEEDAGEPQLVQPLYPVSEWDKKLGRIDANDVSADIYDIVIFFLLSMLCAISSTGGYISLFFLFSPIAGGGWLPLFDKIFLPVVVSWRWRFRRH